MVSKVHSKKLFRKKKTFGQKFLALVRSFDMYGKNIVLTYKGDDKYRTHLGGFASIVVGSVIFLYIIHLFRLMITKGETQFIKSSLLNDVIEHSEIIRPGQQKFDFAFVFSSNGVDYMNSPNYFDVSMSQVEQTWVNASTVRTKKNIGFAKCGDNFSHHDQAEVRRLGINDYYCPSVDDYSVAGTFFSPNFNYIELKVKKCKGSATCKTNAEIEAAMKATRFSMAFENTIVDLKDYVNPIQYIIDDGLYWDQTPGFRKKTDIFIRKNEASFEDSYLQLGFAEDREFYQVATSVSSFESEPSSGDILAIYFRYDKSSDMYERKIYSIADLLGAAGGFYGACLAIGSLFIFIFSERLFVSSVLKRIYQIDTWQEKQMTSGVHDREIADQQNRPVDSQDERAKSILKHKRVPCITDSEKFHEDTLLQMKKLKYKNKDDLKGEKDEILDKCRDSMRERRAFSYGYLSILHYVFCCAVFRRKRSMRYKPKYRDHLYFEVGQEKLLEELDCVTIIKSIRKLNILTQLLLNKRQKFLIKFQRNNIIDSSSSGTSDEGQNNIITLMKSKNSLHKSLVEKKIERVIENYKKKDLQEIDMRVINGIVKKRFSDEDNEEDVEDANFDSDPDCDIGSEISDSEEIKSGLESDQRMSSAAGLHRLDTANELKMPKMFKGDDGPTSKIINNEKVNIYGINEQ